MYARYKDPDALFEVSFANLHKLIDYFTNIGEAVQATTLSLRALRAHHTQQNRGSPSAISMRTEEALRYREELFQSLQTRVATFDKKMNNLINMV